MSGIPLTLVVGVCQHNPKILSKQDKEYNINFAKKVKNKGLLTEKQLKNLLAGRDVVVYLEQFKKWKL